MTKAELSKLTVPVLKERLEALGLSTEGVKEDLMNRLLASTQDSGVVNNIPEAPTVSVSNSVADLKPLEEFVKNNLIMTANDLFRYDAKSINVCKHTDFFKCQAAKDLGVRPGCVVMVVAQGKVEHIVVQ